MSGVSRLWIGQRRSGWWTTVTIVRALARPRQRIHTQYDPPRVKMPLVKPEEMPEIMPELMPSDVEKFTSKKVELFIRRSGIDAVWPVFERKMAAGEVKEKACRKMLEFCRPAMAAAVLKELERQEKADLEAYNECLRRLLEGTDRQNTGRTLRRTTKKMVDSGIGMSSASFAVLMEFFRREGSSASLQKLRERVFAARMRVNEDVYVVLLRHALDTGDHEEIERLFREERQRRVKYTAETLDLVIESRLARGMEREAEHVIKRLRSVNGGSMSMRSVHLLVRYYSNRSNVGAALKIYHHAKLSGPEPDAVVYEVLKPLVERNKSPLMVKELDESYRWNVLREGHAAEEYRQEKRRKKLDRDLKYAGPKSLQRRNPTSGRDKLSDDLADLEDHDRVPVEDVELS